MALTKILFIAEGDEFNDIESLWAETLGEGLYLIKSAPAFVRDVAWGDCVRGEVQNDNLWFKEVIRRGGHGTVWVQTLKPEIAPRVVAACKKHGVMIDTSQEGYFALAVPPGPAMDLFVEELESLEEEQLVEYEIACPSIP
jgi:Domain of unknown function (DUF4265)